MLRKISRAAFGLAASFATVGVTGLFMAPRAQAGAGDLFATDATAGTVMVYGLDGSSRLFATGLGSPQGLTFDGFGNLFVADKASGNIFKFTTDGTRTTFATGLNEPIGLAFDGKDLAVSENGANSVTRVDPGGNLTTFQTFTSPLGLAFERPNLYLADGDNLKVIDDTNNVTTTPVPGSRAVAVDGVFNAFVSSSDGSITQVTPLGVASVFATGLDSPNGMAFRPRRYSDSEEGVGNLFVAETQGGLISEYTPEGVRSVFATGGNPNFLTFELILPGKLLNISTRVNVQTNENVLIGGFIITGDEPKDVLIRGLGPSLSSAPTPIDGALQDPVLELHKPDGSVVINDSWRSDQEAEIETSGLAPTDDREPAIRATLEPGAYTAIVRGSNASTGVAMVEAYDLNADAASELANISTRGLVQTGADCMIGGFIIDHSQNARVLIRALGKSLENSAVPITDALQDPYIELYDGEGNLVKSNDNWRDTAESEISATGIAPTDDKESAILANLRGGNYTAIVRGSNNGIGVGLIEIYHLP